MIKVICTSKEGYLMELPEIPLKTGGKTKLPQIRVDTEKRYQNILGFGIALTDSSCYMLNTLKEEDRSNLLGKLFSPDALNLSVGRLSVGASDYACKPYNYDDTPDDMELNDFCIDYDRDYIIPAIRRAREINPDLFLFSSPWSPPGWMKTGGSMYGGFMREKYLEVYSRYYVRYLKAYEEAGISINALTPQNETETDQTSYMPACFWHPEFEMSFVAEYLRPLLKRNGLDTAIWIMDHNYIMWKRAKWMLDDPTVHEAVDGVAFHGYGGTADMMSLLHQSYPDMELHWTEGGPGLNRNYDTEWCHWGKVFTEALRNWCKSITGWNLALDEEGNPNIGPFKCGGLVTIHSKTHEITYSGQYHAFGQFSRYIRRGAYHTDSTGNVGDILHAAFTNPDGTHVLVVTNPGKEQRINIVVRGECAEVDLKEDSITTFIWK